MHDDSSDSASCIPHRSSLDPRVQQLLNEMFDSERSPEEVCTDCPDLLPDVREHWILMRALEKELNVMFPASEPNREDDTEIRA